MGSFNIDMLCRDLDTRSYYVGRDIGPDRGLDCLLTGRLGIRNMEGLDVC